MATISDPAALLGAGGRQGSSGAQTRRDFDTVFGGLRGSSAAQAERDRKEQDALAVAFNAFNARVKAASGSAFVAKILTTAYLQGRHVPGSAGYELLQGALSAQLHGGTAIVELAVIADIGDPKTLPSLTAAVPWVMGQYFAAPPRGQIAFLTDHAHAVIDVCFPGGEGGAHYERLRPLCEGLGVFLDAQMREKRERGLFMRAAMVLRDAPMGALAEPLRSWVDAFVARIDRKELSARERSELYFIVSTRTHETGFGWALAELVERLSTGSE